MTTPTNTATVKAKIGSQDYSLRVSKASESEVIDAIAMVTARFDAVLKTGKISNHERIAVMVALNLAVELNKTKHAPLPGFEFPNTDIATLRQHIGHVLKA
jgi:cell division protein ZapA (FtsZ GTPase activity inhibitor)